MTAIDRVHAAEQDVAVCQRIDHLPFEQGRRERFDLRAEAKAADHPLCYFYLRLFLAGVGAAAVQDPIEILVLDMVRIDQDETPDTVTRKLLDDRASRP